MNGLDAARRHDEPRDPVVCPHCQQPLPPLQTLLSRTRRARLKAAGRCIDHGGELSQADKAAGHVRCFDCRQKHAARATAKAKITVKLP